MTMHPERSTDFMPARTDQVRLAIDLPAQPRKKMYRTRAEISSAIKSARDIMRKDAGLNGDLDRLPQLSWLLFLRAFSERVDGFRTMENLDYEPALEGRYRWEAWGTNEDFTGEAFLKFINEDLLPYLRELKGSGDDDPRNIISVIFQDVNNRMLSGTLLRDLVNIVDRIDFQADDSVHTMAYVYETIMKEMRDAAGDAGEFYTPRPVIRFMTEQSFLKLEESMMDPACGTGGFLVAAFEQLKKHANSSAKLTQLHNNIRGIEKKPLPYLLCMMNLLLHDVDSPRVVHDNALTRMRNETSPRYRVDVILTNPPFGGEDEESVTRRFPRGYATSETAWLFLYSVIERLKPGGRCAIVLSNSSLFETRKNAKLIKEKLMKECDLHTIVRLPQGVFAPYTLIPANLLFFEKTGPTKEIWYYEIPPPEGRRSYTKTNPMRYEEFLECAEWWSGENRERREANENSWKVDAKYIKIDDYNLGVSKPHAGISSPLRSPAKLLDELIQLQEMTSTEFSHLQKEIARSLAKNLHSESGEGNYPKLRRPMRSAVSLEIDEVTVEDDMTYNIAGVYGFGRGVFARGPIQGHETSYRKLNRLHVGQLIMSRLKAFEGALAIVPQHLDGWFVSQEFPTFRLHEDKLDIDYARHLCRWPSFWRSLSAESKGIGARRERATADRLLSTLIPLPDIDHQRKISCHLNRAASAETLIAEQQLILPSLRDSILNAAFTGQL
ncbi:MAG: N-6 DNA methylase [Pseudonocardiaceae bacterium]